MCISKNIYLADDDEDDCSFFQDALQQICINSFLTIACDGRELMNILHIPPCPLPDVVFLDLNMPAKNGFECLKEIKSCNTLKKLPIIIFSTTLQEEAVNQVYKDGASYYIRKPDNFSNLKKVLKKVLEIDWTQEIGQTSKEKFIVSVV
jgi:CheY-like chemotaxis protein